MVKRAAVLAFVVALVMTAGCGTADPMPTARPSPTDPSPPPTATSGSIPTEQAATEQAATDTPQPPPATAPPVPTEGSSAGGRIAFYSERDGNAEIYTMNPDGSDPRRLTFNPFEDSSPAWSPDGSQIAFISDREDPLPGGCFPNCFYQIYVINADGSDEHKLAETEHTTLHPAWHPDGTRLSFDTESNLQGDIYVVGADGSGLELLIKDGFWADWSPDGTEIVFASNRDRNVEIYVADADGKNQRRLTENARLDFFPAWSPDGRWIAFATVEQKQIYVMNADGSNEQQLTAKGLSEDPAWSPDGTQIAFQSSRDGNFEIYVLDVEDALQGGTSSSPQRLTETRAGDFWPSWGPEATASPSILLAKSQQTFASVPTWKIGLGDLDGDSDLDAVFANSQASPSQVWLNDGHGTFADSGQKLIPYGHGLDLGDLDNDGDLDLFLTSHSASTPGKVYLNDGHSVLQDSGQDYWNVGYRVDLADLDGDGDLDAMAEGSEATALYLNDGTGHFTADGTTLPPAAVGGDLDSDGDVDLVFKEEGAGYTAMLNDGTGTFSPHWTYPDNSAMLMGDMALGDLDNDQDLDLVTTNGHFQSTSHPARIFLNDGSGQFADSGQRLSAVANAGVALGDLDGDGDLDLVLTDYQEPNQIWLNDGTGYFGDSGIRFGEDQFYRHAHLGDLDQDGDLDIFLATFGVNRGPNEIWFNTTPTDRDVKPEGPDLYLGQRPPGLKMEVFAPGIVSAEEGKEYKIAFSPDLQEIVFTRRTPGGRDDRLWVSRLENGALTTPEMAPFTHDSFETDACFTPDGSRLYFNSRRPLPGETAESNQPNVWFVDRTEQGWSEPQFLGPPLNDYRPVYLSIADDGTLYFTRSSPREIWSAELEDGQYLKAQRLPDQINYLKDVAHPAIAPDESYLIVDSYIEEGGRLAGYLYISFRKPDGSWTKATSLRDALKASQTAVHAIPRITPDGKYLFFEEYDAETDKSDLFWISTEAIEELKPRELD